MTYSNSIELSEIDLEIQLLNVRYQKLIKPNKPLQYLKATYAFARDFPSAMRVAILYGGSPSIKGLVTAMNGLYSDSLMQKIETTFSQILSLLEQKYESKIITPSYSEYVSDYETYNNFAPLNQETVERIRCNVHRKVLDTHSTRYLDADEIIPYQSLGDHESILIPLAWIEFGKFNISFCKIVFQDIETTLNPNFDPTSNRETEYSHQTATAILFSPEDVNSLVPLAKCKASFILCKEEKSTRLYNYDLTLTIID